MGATSTALIYAKLGRGLDKVFVTHQLDARACPVAQFFSPKIQGQIGDLHQVKSAQAA